MWEKSQRQSYGIVVAPAESVNQVMTPFCVSPEMAFGLV